MASHGDNFFRKSLVSIWARVCVLLFAPILTSAGQSGILDLEARDTGTAIEVSWRSGSLTSVELYLHYEFQLQKSTDLLTWGNIGELIPGGVRATETESHSVQIPNTAEAEFFRLTYRLNLPDSDLSGLDLSEADLRGSNLSGADLSDADLSHADLRGANLTGTNLDNAQLGYANFTETAEVPRLTEIAGEEVQPAALYLPLISFILSRMKFCEKKGDDFIDLDRRIRIIDT